MANLFTYSVFFFAILLNSPALSVPLKLDFYQKSCPSAEAIVKSTVTKTFVNDSGITAAFLIRIHFHDCFVRVITLLTLIFLIYTKDILLFEII